MSNKRWNISEINGLQWVLSFFLGGLEEENSKEQSKENSKETSKPRNIIVALTAGAFEEDRQRCMDVGMDDFIAKPVSLNDLATVISKWLKP
jgi:CheY-like chemotaxis protein